MSDAFDLMHLIPRRASFSAWAMCWAQKLASSFPLRFAQSHSVRLRLGE